MQVGAPPIYELHGDLGTDTLPAAVERERPADYRGAAFPQTDLEPAKVAPYRLTNPEDTGGRDILATV